MHEKRNCVSSLSPDSATSGLGNEYKACWPPQIDDDDDQNDSNDDDNDDQNEANDYDANDDKKKHH